MNRQTMTSQGMGWASHAVSFSRGGRRIVFAALASMFVAGAMAPEASAQLVTGGDFDIADNLGNAEGNTLRLRGRSGFGTNTATFILINSNSAENDVDRDGFTPGVDFLNLYLPDITDFINVRDPDQVIASTNFVLADFLNPLRNGFQNAVRISVNIPEGTPAGIYRGSFNVADSVLSFPPSSNANGELLRSDNIFVEIEVLPLAGLTAVEADTAAELDSLVLSGRPGQTVQGVVRAANTGNIPLQNVRLETTDLVATSGTGLRIRSDRISFSPAQVTSIGLGDTARITVTVRIPLGILAGRYRGELIFQADEVDALRVPFTVIVTTPGDIVFENNPVFGRNGDNAVIIFNADPGTRWVMRIFDMQAITAFAAEGTVFEGTPPPGGGTPLNGDEAVRYTWTLQNGRGENVAAGMYLVVIEATQAGERRQLRGKLMVIR